jgi:peptide/nickel transport system substrate-binding protein
VAIAFLVATACSAGQTPAAQPTAGQANAPAPTSSAGGAAKSTLVVVYNNTINSLDPVNADFQQSNLVEQALYDTLLTYDADNHLVGRLASSFALSSNASSIEITLRPDAKFHDGTPITAEDVAYSLDRYTRLGKGVAQFIRDYASTTVKDDSHLTINLSQPNSLFLGGLSKIYILNSAMVQGQAGSDDAQGWLSNHDAGSGPFQLAQVEQNGNITVNRSDGYWDFADARPKTIVYRLIEETATQRDELRAGNVDVTAQLSPQDVSSLQGAPGVNILTSKDRVQAYVFFNMVAGPTTNPAVRKAIQLAYDYNGAINKIYNGQAQIANGPLPTTMACHPDLPQSAQNLQQAKDTLASAGVSNLSLTLYFQPAFADQQQEAQLLQSNLKSIGVNLDLSPIAFPDWLARLSDRNNIPQMFLLKDFAQFPDPGVMLVPYYMSTAIGSNRSGYSNPQVDGLLQQALASPDADSQCKAYEQAQQLINNDAVAINMYTVEDIYGYSQAVSGLHTATAASGPYIPDLHVS